MTVLKLPALLCIIAAGTFCNVSAQPLTLRFEKIGGLSQSTGYAVMKDRQNFLWIATGDGLNRFDGVEMQVYRPGSGKSQNEMAGRVIRSEILEDDEERIWFSTEISLHHFDKKSGAFVRHTLVDADGRDTSLFVNPVHLINGHLWLASEKSGLFDLELSTMKSKHYPLSLKDNAGNYVHLMYNGVYDGRHHLWFATHHGLMRFDMNAHQWTLDFHGADFYTIAICRDTLYLSEGRRIRRVPINDPDLSYSYAPVTGQHQPDFIHRLYTDGRLNIWVGDESGNVLCRPYGSSDFSWSGNINYSTTIRTNYPVYSFYSDPSSGMLWIGAYMLGLMKAKVDQLPFAAYPRPEVNKVTETVFVNTFYEQENTEVWLGTFQKGIVILDKTMGLTRSLELPNDGSQRVYGRSVHLIQKDRAGNLWTNSSGHLFVRAKGASSFETIPVPVRSNAMQTPQVWCLSDYQSGWVFGTNLGLYSLVRTRGSYVAKHIPSLGSERTRALWVAPDSSLWIALEVGGIAILPDLHSGERISMLPGTNVRSFCYDKVHEIVWIPTSDGLTAYHFPTRTMKTFTAKDGLINSNVSAVLLNDNELWVSTNSGLFRASVDYIDGSVLPTASFIVFTELDGLPDNQFNPGVAYKGESGDFYFGTPKGIAWFDPKTIRPNLSLPRIVITDVIVDGHPADSLNTAGYLTSVVLPYSTNNLHFKFRGIEHVNPGKVQYEYKMENWDSDWIRNGLSNEVRYSQLAPGDYEFKVRAANSFGLWSESSPSITVRITPPFWRSWWFYALSAIFSVGIVAGITRRLAYSGLRKKLAELRRQQELDRERQRISREMHDDIGAGLTQITLMTEYVRNNRVTDYGKELSDIADTSRQLVNNMSEIIWSMRPENNSVGNMLSYLRERLNKQLEYSGIDYSISFPDDISEVIIANEVRRNILLVTREIVNNAIRHSKAGRIVVVATLKKGRLELEIRDDGVGFDVTGSYRGSGLKNIRERIRGLGGELEITSAPGTGSTFRLAVAC